MGKRAWIIFAAICVMFLGGLVYVSAKDRVNVSDVKEHSILPSSPDAGNIADHVYGNKDSDVVLIVYGDYQCSACKTIHDTIKPTIEQYSDRIAHIYRNFPLTSIHPNALVAAAVAEAAGKQDKYWEMNDLLYANQNQWSNVSANERTEYFVTLAKQLGLDTNSFKMDINSDTVSKKIKYDQALGRKLGINATPTYYLNGKKVDQGDLTDKKKFEALLQNALK